MNLVRNNFIFKGIHFLKIKYLFDRDFLNKRFLSKKN
jgi:hypothetical protein